MHDILTPAMCVCVYVCVCVCVCVLMLPVLHQWCVTGTVKTAAGASLRTSASAERAGPDPPVTQVPADTWSLSHCFSTPLLFNSHLTYGSLQSILGDSTS